MGQKQKLPSISFLLLGIFSSFFGCSGKYQGPESFEEKMSRFKGREKSYTQIAEMPVYSPSLESVAKSPLLQNNRKPASVSPEQDPKNQKDDTNLSNKRLYFLTLYSQYLELSQWSEEKRLELNHCPHFHSSLLANNNHATIENLSKNKNFENIVTREIKEAQLGLYPELILPIETGKKMKSVYQGWISENKINQKDKLKMAKGAYQLHLKKLHSEIKDLCQYGSSDNFYIFENLLGHFKSTPGKEIDLNSKNTEILLRTNIYTNMALISVLREEKMVGPSDYPMFQVYRRVGTQWMSKYYSEIKKARGQN